MRDVGLPESLINQRYMEVWNKIDLVTDEVAFKDKVEKEGQQAKYPVVLMSATQGYNKKVFLEEISEMVQRILGKEYVTIEYPAWEHEKRVKWLLNFAKITDPTNFEVDSEGQNITMRVMMDDVVHMKYLKEFEPAKFEDQRHKKRKHVQPGDW